MQTTIYFQELVLTGYLIGYEKENFGYPPEDGILYDGTAYTWFSFFNPLTDPAGVKACVDIRDRYNTDLITYNNYVNAVDSGTPIPPNPLLHNPYNKEPMDSKSFNYLKQELYSLFLGYGYDLNLPSLPFDPYVP